MVWDVFQCLEFWVQLAEAFEHLAGFYIVEDYYFVQGLVFGIQLASSFEHCIDDYFLYSFEYRIDDYFVESLVFRIQLACPDGG